MQSAVRSSGASLKPTPCLLHPDMFAGYSKSRSACLPYMRNSVRMRSLKQRTGQMRFEKDFEKLYDPSPKRKLSMLRSARRGSFTMQRKCSVFLTRSEVKSDSLGKRVRLNSTELMEKAAGNHHTGLRKILVEHNRSLL